MIRHLEHTDIDKVLWDERLRRSPDRLWYLQAWVLDRCCPEWEALVDDDGWFMPLLWRRKFGVDYLYQPYAVQFQGVFGPHRDAVVYAAFLAAVPDRFKYWDIHVGIGMDVRSSTDLKVAPKRTQELPLDEDIDTLRSGYSKGHRRNLRPMEDVMVEVVDDIGIEEFIAVFLSTTGRRYRNIPAGGLELLRRLLQGAKERGELAMRGIRDNKELIAAACFIVWEGRAILLKSANTAVGQERKAMFRIIDHFIAGHAGSHLLLDFAGSNSPSTIRFNEGFGARSKVYLHLVRNRLPAPFKWFK